MPRLVFLIPHYLQIVTAGGISGMAGQRATAPDIRKMPLLHGPNLD